MKQIQGSFISGYVTLRVKGRSPEMFFQACINEGIPVWNIKKESAETCRGNIKLKHVSMVKTLRRQHGYKIKFIHKRGIPFLTSHFFGKKELVTGLILSFFLVLFLSNIIWKVEITGVPKDLEEKINKQLTSYGIHSGVWIFKTGSPGDIQRKLENDIPELLWVGVEQRGTTFFLEGVEKIIVEKEKVEGPRDMVATKKGVIKKMYISKGQPMVHFNEYVKPGDLLVSGNLSKNITEDAEEESERDPIYVASEGEVIANTWYELNVSIPLETNFERLTGEQDKKYYIQMKDFHLPIWGFRTPDYELSDVDNNETPLRFLKWDFPINLVESIISEKQAVERTRNKEEAIEIGIEQAKKELLRQLEPEAEIISDKILHETTENGKVKLKLYVSVEEDIVNYVPINKKKEKEKTENNQ